MQIFNIPPIAPETILSFGYGNKPADCLDQLLAKYPGIMILDCRRNPVCTWSGDWYKKALMARFGEHYWWAGPVLGNGEHKEQLDGGGWLIPRGFDMQETIAHLDGIRQKLDSRGWLPLFMCGCGDQSKCHRRFILPVAQVVWPGWKIQTLWGKG